jgi:chemotaxis family two-component system response regulator Rcp1
MSSETVADILLVEDNEGDVELTKLAFEEANVPVNLVVANDGAAALEYLHQKVESHQVPTPKLILLDINMPRMDGMEFLQIIKQDERLKVIPVIMLTSSRASKDILESYRRHANSYILKPDSIERRIDMAKQLHDFWINLAQAAA